MSTAPAPGESKLPIVEPATAVDMATLHLGLVSLLQAGDTRQAGDLITQLDAAGCNAVLESLLVKVTHNSSRGLDMVLWLRGLNYLRANSRVSVEGFSKGLCRIAVCCGTRPSAFRAVVARGFQWYGSAPLDAAVLAVLEGGGGSPVKIIGFVRMLRQYGCSIGQKRFFEECADAKVRSYFSRRWGVVPQHWTPDDIPAEAARQLHHVRKTATRCVDIVLADAPEMPSLS